MKFKLYRPEEITITPYTHNHTGHPDHEYKAEAAAIAQLLYAHTRGGTVDEFVNRIANKIFARLEATQKIDFELLKGWMQIAIAELAEE